MYTNTGSKVQVINQLKDVGHSLTYSYEDLPQNFIKTANSFYQPSSNHHDKEEQKVPIENSTSSKFYLTSKNKVGGKIPKNPI